MLGKHVHGEIDPHLWQDVRNVMAYVELIRDTKRWTKRFHKDWTDLSRHLGIPLGTLFDQLLYEESADEMKARVFGNLSERGRVTLQEEIDVLKSAKGHEVSEARRKVVAQARALEEQGVIELTRESDEESEEFGG